MRVILYTGKGGVGKTSISAATGVRCAELGYSTLVMSTDPAHSLSDSFDMQLKGEPTKISKKLWGLEIDPFKEVEENWSIAKDYLTSLFTSQGLEMVMAEELAVFPGMDELFSLLKINEYHKSGEYEVLIVDCAPTGATIRLLSFPEVVRWYMKKLFHVERVVVKTVRRVTKQIVGVPLPEDEYFETIQRLYEKVGAMKEVLVNPKLTTVRMVLNPEKMVIQESRRAYTYLNLFGFYSDAVIANKVLPDEVTDAYFDQWKKIQQGYLDEITSSFGHMPLFKVKFYDHEVVGLRALREMAQDTYGDVDPTQVLFMEEPMRILKEGKAYTLILKLPFTRREEVELFQKGDEMIVKIGNFKRNLVLPMTLARLEPQGAKFVGETLQIGFSNKRRR